MFYFIADPTTYHRVHRKSTHAFATAPVDWDVHELVLLAETRDQKRTLHKQVQYLAKILDIRAPDEGELERLFPGVNASARWKHVVDLYWARPLPEPFNLQEIEGVGHASYRTVQQFKRLPDTDAKAVFDFLCKRNASVVLDFINRADPDDPAAR